MIKPFDSLISALFQAWLGGGGVGGATGVLVGFWAGENFVGDADFRGCDL